MVRATRMRQTEKVTGKSTDQSASAAGTNSIESDTLSPHLSDADARHLRIATVAHRIAESRGFEGGSELEDWLAAEREVDAEDRNSTDHEAATRRNDEP